VDAGTTELVTLGVFSRHRDSFPHPSRLRQRVAQREGSVLKEVFRHLRTELGVEVARAPKKLPYVPAEDEIRRYDDTVWTAHDVHISGLDGAARERKP
jgi:hypothetical protein